MIDLSQFYQTFDPNLGQPGFSVGVPQPGSFNPAPSSGVLSGAPPPGPLSGSPGGSFWNQAWIGPVAAALLGGRTFRGSMAGAAQAVAQTMPMEQKRQALNAWLQAKSSGDPAALDAAQTKLMQVDPDLAQSVVANQMAPHREWSPIGTNLLGQTQYGFVDPFNRTVEPGASLTGSPAGGQPSQDPNAAVPNGVYDSLSSPQKAQVDQMLQGKMPFPGGMALKTPYWITLMQAANERAQQLGDPGGFDATQWPVRLKAKEDFTSGKSAQTITAGNTAIGHLGDLDAQVDKLGNFSGVPLANYALNAARNAVKGASGTAIELQKFDAIKSKYSQEITKFYRGSGGSEGDIQEAMRQLDGARSPEELHAVVKAQVQLLHSKISALQDQWHSAMGASGGDFPIISPKSQLVLQRIAPEELAGGAASAAPAAGVTHVWTPQTGLQPVQ